MHLAVAPESFAPVLVVEDFVAGFGLVAVGEGEVAGAGLAEVAGAAELVEEFAPVSFWMPPWWLQAPLPDFDIEPSLQVTVLSAPGEAV